MNPAATPGAESRAQDNMPQMLRVSQGQLEMTWQDGRCTQATARHLRQGCRCGECSALRLQAHEITTPGQLALLDVSSCGPYAVRLWFSDGHSRGIFPFAYLRELGD